MSIRRALGAAVVAAGLMVPTVAVFAQPAAASTCVAPCGGGAGKVAQLQVVGLVVKYVPGLTLVQQRALLAYINAHPAQTANILNAIAARLPSDSALRAQLQALAAAL